MASSHFRIPALSEQHVLDNVKLHLFAPAMTPCCVSVSAS